MVDAPSSSWNLVRVYGTWHTQGGTLKPGKYTVTIPARITNHTDDAIIPAGQYDAGDLQVAVSSSPSLDIMVPCNDDPDNDQTGWKPTITVTFSDGSAKEVYTIDVPYADRPLADGGTGNGVNLRTVAFPTQLPQTVTMYKVGVANGLAQLDGAGMVINSDGSYPTGGTELTSYADQVASLDDYPASFPATWSGITGKPAVIASGTDQAAARASIGAGTSSFSGAYADLSGKPAIPNSPDDIGAQPAGDYATSADLSAKYTKPGTGIPKTDLASTVQTSLGKADSALQSVPSASTSTAGIVQLAASGDTTSTNKAATPALVAAAVAAGSAVSDRIMAPFPGTRPDDGGKPLQWDDTAVAITNGADTSGPDVGLLEVGDYWWTIVYEEA
jgi:hypothetical protein